jgi:insertion element IS1 protein InsB
MNHSCNYCKTICIKKGIRNKTQKYFCKNCSKYQQKKYKYRTQICFVNDVLRFTVEGNSISSTARLTGISKSSVQRKLYSEGAKINKPVFEECNQEYELDEMTLTIAGMKDIYLIYAINRKTRQVIDFVIGNRTKENIKKVVDSVLFYRPRRIFTDGLNSYPSLIPSQIHKPGRHITNRIERKNLTLRNFIKRLSRATICVTRNIKMLVTTIKLVCWRNLNTTY